MRAPRRLIIVLAAGWLATACSTAVGGHAVAFTDGATKMSASPRLPTAITEPEPGPTLGSTSATTGVTTGPGAASTAATSTAPTVKSTATSTATPDVTSTATPDGAIGGIGIGDPYYPDSGNGGYEVDHYNITLRYDPVTNRLAGTTVVSATVTETQRLGRFDLDLQPSMVVSAVSVNGSRATFEHPGAELMITPDVGLTPGASLQVAVTYSGRPTVIPGGTADLGDGGWYRTPSGGAIAIGEPFSGSAWYPVNEHPSDPATYQVTATVPAKWSVISNGVAATSGLPAAAAGMKVFRWTQAQAITSYESTIYIDTFSTMTDTTTDGKPIVSVFAPGPNAGKYRKLAVDTKVILQVLSHHFGPYPFDAAGGIYTDQNLAFALETATRPVYANWVDTDTIVHELTHQWFGDDVVIKRWSDICLNECFASYGPWLWHQDIDGTDLDAQWVQQMADAVDDATFWSSPLVNMGAGNEFTSVYTRGPLAVHALRKQMGEKKFAALLTGWPATYGGKVASWNEFVSYVNRLSGQNLTQFLNAWFVGRTTPPAQFLHPGGLGR